MSDDSDDDSQGHSSKVNEILRQADDDVIREIGEDPDDYRDEQGGDA